MSLDRRLTAARPGLAAAQLKGQVEAARFVEGRQAQIGIGRASLRAAPSPDAPQDSELLHGERVTVYDRQGGWAWLQAEADGYVGYLREDALADAAAAPLRVSALMAPLFAAPDLKSPVRDLLPLNALVADTSRRGDYIEIAPQRFAHRRHLLAERERDFAAIAERFVGAPYVWGGKTVAGLDCSGLIQTAMRAVGRAVPRDTDMQEKFFPEDADVPRRGDLVFWKGHMGVMLDGTRLLHANAFHMLTVIEPLAAAMARIEKTSGPVTSVKRPR